MRTMVMVALAVALLGFLACPGTVPAAELPVNDVLIEGAHETGILEVSELKCPVFAELSENWDSCIVETSKELRLPCAIRFAEGRFSYTTAMKTDFG